MLRTPFEVWVGLLRAQRRVGTLLVWTSLNSAVLLVLVIVLSLRFGAVGAAIGVSLAGLLTAVIGGSRAAVTTRGSRTASAGWSWRHDDRNAVAAGDAARRRRGLAGRALDRCDRPAGARPTGASNSPTSTDTPGRDCSSAPAARCAGSSRCRSSRRGRRGRTRASPSTPCPPSSPDSAAEPNAPGDRRGLHPRPRRAAGRVAGRAVLARPRRARDPRDRQRAVGRPHRAAGRPSCPTRACATYCEPRPGLARARNRAPARGPLRHASPSPTTTSASTPAGWPGCWRASTAVPTSYA